MANAQNYTKLLAQSMANTKMQAINAVFEEMYRDVFNKPNLKMPRRGRYQVWRGEHTLVADRIKHRKQALALIKLLKGNDEYDV